MTKAQSDGRYLALWRRMDGVVRALTEMGDTQTADYHMIDFFMCFDEVDELERHVELAELTLKEQSTK